MAATDAAAFAGIRQLLGSTTLRDYLSSRPPSTIVVLRTDETLERSLKVRSICCCISENLLLFRNARNHRRGPGLDAPIAAASLPEV
jgi:hypothetical protein